MKKTEYALSKEEFVQQMAAQGKKWAQQDLQILELYRAYVLDEEIPISCEEAQAEETEQLRLARRRDYERSHRIDAVVALLMQRHRYEVRSIVQGNANYHRNDEEVAIQMATEAVMNLMRRDRAVGIPREGITAVFKRIFINQAYEFLRQEYHCRKASEAGSGEQVPQKETITMVSLDSILEDEDGKDITDRWDKGAGNFLLDNLQLRERDRRAHSQLLMYYREILNCDEEPQKPIAALYVHELYQIMRRFSPEEIDAFGMKLLHQRGWKETEENIIRAIQDAQYPTTETSAKWAVEKMGDGLLGELGQRGLEMLREHYDPSLQWGAPYCHALPLPSPYQEGTVWSQLKYLDTFTQKQISTWAREIYKKAVIRASVKRANADPAAHQLMRAYFEEGR